MAVIQADAFFNAYSPVGAQLFQLSHGVPRLKEHVFHIHLIHIDASRVDIERDGHSPAGQEHISYYLIFLVGEAVKSVKPYFGSFYIFRSVHLFRRYGEHIVGRHKIFLYKFPVFRVYKSYVGHFHSHGAVLWKRIGVFLHVLRIYALGRELAYGLAKPCYESLP